MRTSSSFLEQSDLCSILVWKKEVYSSALERWNVVAISDSRTASMDWIRKIA